MGPDESSSEGLAWLTTLERVRSAEYRWREAVKLNEMGEAPPPPKALEAEARELRTKLDSWFARRGPRNPTNEHGNG